MAGQTFLQKIKVFLEGANKASKDAKKVSRGMDDLAKSALKAGAAYFSAQGIINAMSKSIELFRKQEEAENKLKFAMGGVSTALLNQAKALQQNSRFGDEAILAQQAFLAANGQTEEQILKMIPAILDMSEALGTPLEFATRNLVKTFSGLQGELGELIPDLKQLTQEQLINRQAVDVLSQLYGGFASSALDTYGGKLDQLGNRIGDIGEVFAGVLLPVITPIAQSMVKLAEHFDAGKMKAYAITVGSAAVGYGLLSGAIKKAALATISFTKATKKNVFILGATIAVSELLDAIGFLDDGMEELEKDIKKLNTGLDDNISKNKQMSLQAQELARLSEMRIRIEEGMNEVMVEHQDVQKELFDLEENYNTGLVLGNEYLLQKEQLLIRLLGTEKKVQDFNLKKSQAEKKLASDSINTLATIAQAGKMHYKDIANLQAVASVVDAFASAQSSMAQVAKLLPPPAPQIAYGVTLASGLAQAKMTRDAATRVAAEGMDEIVTEPTLILAGEEGAEYVNIEPTMNEGAGRGGANITITGNVLSRDFIEDEAVPMIREALRKGGDIGIG